VTQVAAGDYHTMALTVSGAVVCWGRNLEGQCEQPPAGLLPPRYTQIAAGAIHSVALSEDGAVACWGDNEVGQCSVPAGIGFAESIAAGGNTTSVVYRGPDRCSPDLVRDGVVDGADLALLLSAWGTAGTPQHDSDLDGDGVVGGGDLAVLIGGWGRCPD
jgi:hypothetical protein